MDYQLNVYPSSEREMQNMKADNAAKQIKILQEQKLAPLYKKSFGPAVKKYNERAISGKLIDNYYQSILESNVPEVYRLSLVIRYELLNKSDLAAIQKAFMDFKKTLEKESYFGSVSSYVLSYEEYKELVIFFYPITDGYATGLAVRNDLIDIVKRWQETKNNMNILQAMPIFVQKMDEIFKPINNGQFSSQSELEAQARRVTDDDPMSLHAIAVETLKAQMNGLQKINAENQRMEALVQNEKSRIRHDIQWSKAKEAEIYRAEEARIEEERRLAEEARRAEEIMKAAEAQKREEERLREEARRLEAERLAEQARRNIELRKQLAQQEEEARKRRVQRSGFTQFSFGSLLERHFKWQEAYGIDETIEYSQIPEAALNDPRRINLNSADIHGISFDRTIELVGATFNDCEFIDCHLSVDMIASSLSNCKFMNCELSDLYFKKCIFNNINLERLLIDNIKIDDTTAMKLNLKNATVSELFSSPGSNFIKGYFVATTFRGCDMKKNTFSQCDFTDANFVSCDMRDSSFQVCKVDRMNKDGSLFRGAKFNNT